MTTKVLSRQISHNGELLETLLSSLQDFPEDVSTLEAELDNKLDKIDAHDQMVIVSTSSASLSPNTHAVVIGALATTLTLSSTPSSGDIVRVTIANNRLDNVIISAGKSIQGISENLVMDIGNASIQLRYINNDVMWRIV